MSVNTLTTFVIIAVLNILTIASEPKRHVKLVSVVFRHGDRTPDIVYPKMPYTNDNYFPNGVGGLTNNGKKRAYQLGEVLREKYNQFLGPIYYPDNVYAQSTDYVRTKMTLQLVLAAMYPPSELQRWNSHLDWQPIPTVYVPEQNDKLLLRTYYCNSFLENYENLKKEAYISEKLERFENAKEELTNITGWKMNDIYDLYTLHCNLVCLNYMDKHLPNWVSTLSSILNDSTVTTFNLMNYNNLLKKLNGGALLRKVAEDMKLVADGDRHKHKVFLYSSHDLNVYAMLASLNVVQPHLPEFTSAVIIELYTINEVYYVEVLHYLGIPSVIKTLEIPNCGSPCPLSTFFHIIKDVIPSDEELKC